jgi:hypothetical protein
LRDHIERLDNGAVHAADDLAVVLRALLCGGTGNRVLQRLYRECDVAYPDILLSRPPAIDATVQFSVGSIPTREAGAVADSAVRIPLNRWPHIPLVVITLEGRQQKFTWDQFLNAYANKWGGAHLDVSVPAHLQFIDYYAAGGLSLTGYLLRAAAVEVWLLAQEVYRKVMPEYIPAAFPRSDLEKGWYSAQGAVNVEPRDISCKGQLQWFCHDSDRLGLLWYVDENSRDNAMHWTLGQIPYDIRYTPASETVAEQTTPLAFQAPRRRLLNEPIAVDRTKLKSLTLDYRIKTLAEVRQAVVPTEGSEG